MACRNCFDNCAPLISDKCVKYTGPSIELLDICTGDSIYVVEAIIIEKLLSALDGTGITPKDVTIQNSPELINLLKYKDPTLNNLLQIIIDNQKALSDKITNGEGLLPYIFDLKNLVLDENPSKDEIIQALINQSNVLKQLVDIFPSKYIKNDDLKTLVNNIIKGVDAENPDVISNQFYLKMIPGVLYPYVGSLSNFDSTGKGLAGQGFDKIYLYNGLNGTNDARGRALVGAVKNVPGGTLNPAVDPLSPSNPNVNYAVGDKFGKSSEILAVNQIPNHSHLLIDPGHKHEFTHGEDSSSGNNNDNFMKQDSDSKTRQTKTSFTGITIQATGGGEAHNNVQPSIGVLYIAYIPS